MREKAAIAARKVVVRIVFLSACRVEGAGGVLGDDARCGRRERAKPRACDDFGRTKAV